MLISLAWLARHVDLVGVDVSDLGNRFTLTVAELDGIRKFGEAPEAVVGVVRSMQPIPGTTASVCTVDTGNVSCQAVTEARNVVVGHRLIVSVPGTQLAASAPVRKSYPGVKSEAFVLTETDLGLGTEQDVAIVLSEPASLGQSVSSLAPFEDSLLEIDNKSLTHRPDLWGHRGIAREIAALLGRKLRSASVESTNDGPVAWEVDIRDPEGCLRYCAVKVSNVEVVPSPLWLRLLLHRVGVRPINNVVDATNFVMLDLGNPVHAFDCKKLRSTTITVRRAEPQETLETLDGETRLLVPDDLVIADGAGAVALAGIIGGERSAIDVSTTDVLLEAATFAPASVRRTSQRFGLRTEASARFEKSLDPTLPEEAARAFVQLLHDVSPGCAASSRLSCWGSPLPEAKRISVDLQRVNQRLGVELSADDVDRFLSPLGFHVRRVTPDVFEIEVPSYRATKDITEEVDVIEELGRCYGYNRIVPTAPSVTLVAPDPQHRKVFERRVKAFLTLAAGFDEVLTYSFSSDAFLTKFGLGVEPRCLVQNPVSTDLAALRTDLATGLIDALNRNAQNFPSLAMFEVGRVFFPPQATEELPEQPTHLAGLVADTEARTARGEPGLFFRMKGVLDGLARALDRPELTLEQGGVSHAFVHPVRCAQVTCLGRVLGYVAELHPSLASRLERPFTVAVFEIDLDALREFDTVASVVVSPPQFPAVYRDFAWVVPEATRVRDIETALRTVSPYIVQVVLQSVYRGDGVPDGYKSVAWSLTFRHPERTLTDIEVQAPVDALRALIESKFQGRLR